ncbi:response regulator [Eubacterium barkeri]|uniref:Stage 0 sporulation protein A homolog n=1 Tax=Eubacterium barkeri TaxID=1528 RepID=A0A1H3I1B4_EUBBA|nr:response regulator [Eubacterium barkeri]SDY21507.1 PAS domain S-box-containing protein [Eubacterium barkeri]
MDTKMMLIVDDMDVNREILSEYFSKDFLIIAALDGEDAIQKIEQYAHRITIILLDIIMPKMDGIAVLKWIQASPYRSIPIIAITAESGYQLEALENGAWDFIGKPLDRRIIQARVHNILGRYALENAQQRNAQLLQGKREADHLINSIPGGIAIYRFVDNCLKAQYFSDGVAQLTGHSRGEYAQIIADDATALLYDGDQRRLLGSATTALKEGHPIDEIYRFYHKDGSLIWVRMTAMPIGEEEGYPIIHAVFQRPTRMTELYDNLVNDSQNLIYVSDIATYDLLYINRTGLKSIGREQEDYTQKKCYAFLFGRLAPCDFCKIREMSTTCFLERDYEYPVTGQIFTLRGKLIEWNGIPAHVEYIDDVTAARRTEQERLRLSKQLESMMENIPGGMCAYRIDDRGIHPEVHNQAFFELFGYSEEHQAAVMNQTNFLGVHPEDLPELKERLGDTIAQNGKINHTYRIFNDREGRYLWVNLNGVVIPQKDGTKLCYANYTNVDKLKEVEQALLENQLRYEVAVKSSGINIWEYDIQEDSLFVISNSPRIKQNCFQIPHYTQSTLENGFVREDAIPTFLNLFDRLRQGVPEITADIWYKTTDKAGFWCERVTYTSTFDANGNPIKAFGAGRDVTREKEAEKKFQEELSYRKAAQSDNLVTIILDLTDNRVLEISSIFQCVRDLKGNTASHYFEETAKHITGHHHYQQFKDLFNRKALLHSFSSGNYLISMEVTRLFDTPKIFWLHYSAHLMQNPRTKHIVAQISSIDITQKKVMQTVMETVAKKDYDFLVVVDGSVDSAQDYAVKSKEQLYDPTQSYEQQHQHFIHTYVCPEDQVRVSRLCKTKDVWSKIKSGNTYKISFGLLLPNGHKRHKQLQFTAIDRLRKTFLMSCIDVTNIYEEQEAAKAKLKQALELAEHANHAKTDFLSRMSHDIRTPMNAVLTLASLGQDSQDLAEIQDYLEKIETSGRYLLAIINDVLDLRKLENHPIALHPVAVFLPDFIQETMAIVRPTALEKQIDLQLQIQGMACHYLMLDTTAVQQVIVNLLSNAIKFTPIGGSVTLILNGISRDKGFFHSQVTVLDTGIGIAPEFLPKLFLPFEQENTQDDVTRQGTGLGLSIVKSIIDQMGGRIWVDSTPGQGSAFHVDWQLPEATAEDCSQMPPKHPNIALDILFGKHILLAEDHPLNAEIAQRLLSKKGMNVTIATNGTAALEYFDHSVPHTFDAILMDIRMPQMNGLEATRAIRHVDHPDAKTIPIIAMTANAFEEDIDTAMDAGMDAHLSKPIDRQKLYQTLARLIEQSVWDKQKPLP